MTTKRERMYQRIEMHGRNLLALFPDAAEQDPVKLCKKLRTLEHKMHRQAEHYCNIPDYPIDELSSQTIKCVWLTLGDGDKRVWFNRDPRGYALKVDLAPGEHLYRDMGGYGIIAPDLTND